MTVQKQFTIDNCVTTFSMDKATKTKVGYQFWFADADFIDGRTLKMSVVVLRMWNIALKMLATRN